MEDNKDNEIIKIINVYLSQKPFFVRCDSSGHELTQQM